MHSSTRSTWPGRVTDGSGRTGWNVPVVRSSTALAAALSRSIDFGVKTISGRRGRAKAWRRSRWKYDAGVLGMRHRHVVLGAHLQVALDPRGGVVRALPLVAVRQQQHDRGALAPLLLRAEMNSSTMRLRAVGEVAELGLPQHERVRPLDRVAVLEAHRRELAQQRVVDPEPGLLVGEVEQRRPLLAVSLSMSTACRWTKVPRRLSWPARRTGTPSSSSEPKASSSPIAQSMPPSRGHRPAPVQQLLDLAGGR